MIWFVYRSPYHGVLGKHVRELPDASVLDWFRRGWDEAAPDSNAWLQAELGVDVYGLHTVFDEVDKRSPPKPESMAELREHLKKHLYVEGRVMVDDHSVRALTDDDEVPLAYFFLDHALVDERPARLAYPVHGRWPLPTHTGTTAGHDDPVTTIAMSQILAADWDTPGTVIRVPGVRLPELAGWLRAADTWPEELTLLRGCIGPDDDLAAALDRMNRWGAWDDEAPDLRGMDGPHEDAHGVVRSVTTRGAGRQVIPGPLGQRRPALSRVEVTEHLAQAVLHMDDDFGYLQLFLFDDVWASEHRYLAKSLRRWFGRSWDPLK
ncbi:hypothetical protein Ate01nite_56020 [Actinoplanes teichomyceticus]|nr:hypothetical protein Ate01nite_56020 [Actinoplanes teichomyceticus]